MGDGEVGLEFLDPGVVERVGAEEFGLLAAMFFVVCGKSFPEADGVARIVSGLGHEDEADLVGFEFLVAGEREAESDLGSGSIELAGSFTGAAFDALAAEDGVEQGTADREGLLLLDPVVGVVGGDVGDLMSHDGGEAGIVPGDGEESGVHADLAAREGKGVGRFVLKDDELPLGAGQGDDAFDAIGHPPELGVVGGIARDRFLLLVFLKELESLRLEIRIGLADRDVALLIDRRGRGGAGGEQEQARGGGNQKPFHGVTMNGLGRRVKVGVKKPVLHGGRTGGSEEYPRKWLID